MKHIKKLYTLLAVFAIMLTLAACGKQTPIAYITEVAPNTTDVSFAINIIDMDDQVQGTIVTLNIYKDDDSSEVIVTQTYDLSEVKGTAATKTVSGLTEQTAYRFEVVVTVNDQKMTISKDIKFTTLDKKIYEIHTVEDFLNISSVMSTYNEFHLKDNLDFNHQKPTKYIASFSKIFNGNGFTIKNYYSDRSLFGSVSAGTIENLKIDNMIIAGDKSEDLTYGDLLYTSSSDKNYGFIADQATSWSTTRFTTMKDITISNSQMHLKIDAQILNSTQKVRIGSIAGNFQGYAQNIEVTDTAIHVKSINNRSIYVGGLFGFAGRETATTSNLNYFEIKESKADVDIVFNQSVDTENKTKYTFADSISAIKKEVYIGTLVGHLGLHNIGQTVVKDLISYGTITANLEFAAIQKDIHEKDDEGNPVLDDNGEKKYTAISQTNHAYIGGLFGKVERARLRSIYFGGAVTINHKQTYVFDYDQALEPSNKVTEAFYLGGLIGENFSNNLPVELFGEQVNVTVTFDSQSEANMNISDTIGKASNDTFKAYYTTVLGELRVNDDIVQPDSRYLEKALETSTSEYLKKHVTKIKQI